MTSDNSSFIIEKRKKEKERTEEVIGHYRERELNYSSKLQQDQIQKKVNLILSINFFSEN